jgi:hypothetical protein
MGKPLDKEKERYWRGVFQSQQQSGDSIAAFCGTRRIAVHQFYWWRRRLQRSQESRKSDTQKLTAFIPMRLPSMTDAMEIVHPNGCIVRLKSHVDAAALRQVLQALNSSTVREE